MCKFLKFKKFENNVILNYGKENLKKNKFNLFVSYFLSI